jgi:hypothetical protein
MRRLIVVAASIILLTSGWAGAEEPVQKVPLSAAVPMPRPAVVEVSQFRLVAIGAGAIVGVIAANVLSGGMITPFLAGGSLLMPADAAAPIAAAAVPAVAAVPAAAASVAAPVAAATSAAMMATHAGIVAVGGVIGAAGGNWLYGIYGSH